MSDCGRWPRQEASNLGFTSSEKVSSLDGRGDPDRFTSRTEGLGRRLSYMYIHERWSRQEGDQRAQLATWVDREFILTGHGEC